MDVQALVNRVKSDFLEMPGLRLTHRQAQRLWALDARQCEEVLDALVRDAFLRRHPNGTVSRANGTRASSHGVTVTGDV